MLVIHLFFQSCLVGPAVLLLRFLCLPKLHYPLSWRWAQGELVYGLCALVALHMSSEGQGKNGHARISDPEPQDHHPSSSVNPPGQTISTFECTKPAIPTVHPHGNSPERSLHSLWATLPFVSLWLWATVDLRMHPTLLFPGQTECHPTIFSGVTATPRAVAQLCALLFHLSQGMSSGPNILVLFSVLKQSTVSLPA